MRRPRPVDHIVVPNLAAVVHVCNDRRIACLVLDVEPIIVRWGAASDIFAQRVAAVREMMFVSVPTLQVLALVTNSTRPVPSVAGDIVYVPRAWKPWRIGWAAQLPAPTALAGDLVVTDGIVAARIGAVFLQHVGAANLPVWTRVQQAIGKVLEPLLFSRPVSA